jgi:hypothetical protein
VFQAKWEMHCILSRVKDDIVSHLSKVGAGKDYTGTIMELAKNDIIRS